MAAAREGKSVKIFLIELAQARIDEFKWEGILPRGDMETPRLKARECYGGDALEGYRVAVLESQKYQ